MLRLSLLLALVWLGGCSLTPVTSGQVTASVDEKSGVHEYWLDNGLKLIVKEDHRAPVVVSQVWYKVGSSYEHNGITGVSHLLEHMMFKGTDNLAPGEFSRIISANGGSENAFTGRDYTAYFQRLEKSRLPVSFELEADRMRHLKLDEEEFKKELQVVMEERRLRTEDEPEALTYERFNAAAYISSTYHNPIIGWMDDLESMRLGDLSEWYRNWYAPNNATLVVVGDVQPHEVLALAKKYFGPLKPSTLAQPRPQQEPDPMGLRRITVKAPAKLSYVLMGYSVPVVRGLPEERAWEPYALVVLAGILDGGDSARITTRLIRGEEVVSSAGAGYTPFDRLGGQFLLEGTPAQGKGIEEVEQALRAEVEKLHRQLVDDNELERVKAQVVASDVYERDSVFYQAMQIGKMETVGLDWRLMDEYVANIQAVTAQQVQAVARKYLTTDRLTVAVLEPQPIAAGAAKSQHKGAGHGH